MARKDKIVVLSHENDKFWPGNYILKLLIAEWQKQGIAVEVQCGPTSIVDSSISFLHVNLTRVPNGYLKCLRRCEMVINGGARDISKRLVADNVVRPHHRYRDAVIVKTNRNYGGLPEIGMTRRGAWHKRLSRFTERLPWTWTGRLHPYDYPIFDRVRDVPLSVWLNRRLVVQKFEPEVRDGYYCLRNWVFLGDKGFGRLLLSKEPIVKATNIVHHEPIDTVPEELRAMRKQLGFDYGKFDYGIVADRVVLYDANRTPTYGGEPSTQESKDRIAELSRGIHEFIGRR